MTIADNKLNNISPGDVGDKIGIHGPGVHQTGRTSIGNTYDTPLVAKWITVYVGGSAAI
jgi:hypothetical protein